MYGNFLDGAKDLDCIGNKHFNREDSDHVNPSLYVNPNWRLSNDSQLVSPY